MRTLAGHLLVPGAAQRENAALQTRDHSRRRTREGPGSAVHRYALHRIRDTHYITRFSRLQPLSADQMPRSSRKRSIGADDLMALMR